jgi:isoquinoline 1-oxidoreductase beta subunit
MSRLAVIPRRDFIRSGALAGAGLVIGFTIPVRGAAAEGAAKVAGKAAAFKPNAWLQIDPAGRVTVWIHKSEMGQGVRTSLPMLVAEELEIGLDRVRVENALPGPDYPNMVTGGSWSVRGSWKPLREAGAAAREMLIEAAAGQWGVERSQCRAEQGEIVHSGSNRRLAYGDLAEAAAKLEPPKEPPLKQKNDFRLLGKKQPRLDTPSKVDGSAVFGLDFRVPGMLYAAVARCPVFGGKAAGHEAAKATGVAGVRQVLPIESGIAVVADSTWAAFQGRDALEVRWDEGPNGALSSADIARKFEEMSAKPGAVARAEGEAEKALASASRKLQAVYEVPFLAHSPMEPPNCTAHARADACDVWAPTQVQTWAQERAAEITGLPKASVRIHTTLLGGGFGRRLETDDVAEAVEISKKIGAPVKVVWTREDEIQHGFYRPASRHVLGAGLDAQGRPAAWTHRIVAPSITGQRWPEEIKNGMDFSAVEGAANFPYAIPNLKVDYVMANTPVPTGWWRAVYSTQNAFAQECFIDEVAAAAGKDPLQFRLDLLRERRSIPGTEEGDPAIDTARFRGVLELAAQKCGWGKPLPRGRGRGIAAFFSFGSQVAEVAEVTVSPEGRVRVDRVVCAVDCGMTVNPDTLKAQIEGGVVFALSAALKGAITLAKGRVEQSNFHDYEMARIDESPDVEVHIVDSDEPPGGIGEPGVPPMFAALANAVFAATGKRVRRLPIQPADLKQA